MLALANFIFCLFLNPVSETILVPYDHHLPDSRQITVEIEFLNGFESNRETVFLLEDAFDRLFLPFVELQNFSGSVNFVLIKGRKDSPELKKGVLQSGVPDYQLAYRLYNQDQVARDVEVIRRKLLGDRQVVLLGFSSSSMVLKHYLSLFPQHVSRMVSVNPLIFDIQKNLSFRRYSLPISSFGLEPKEAFDFGYYANFQSLNDTKEKVERASYANLIQFLTFRNLLRGVATKEPAEQDFALLVRMFEHSVAMSGLGDKGAIDDPNLELLKDQAKELWKAYSESDFKFYGTNYDRLFGFPGKFVLIGGAFDQLVYPKSYDVLAEFFPDCTLLLVKDGHALQRLAGAGMLGPVLAAFLEDNTSEKVVWYRKLSAVDLLFRKYEEGQFAEPFRY